MKCITHNFLESGHSHMECDSMHAAIEHEKKFVDVFTMLDWVSIFRRARRSHPYKVHNVTHRDFYDFQKLAKEIMKNRRIGLEGNTINWLLVKSFQYKKDHLGVLFYPYDYGDEYKAIRISGRGRILLQQLYSTLMITRYQLAKQSIMIFVSYVTKWLFRQKYMSGTTHYQHLHEL